MLEAAREKNCSLSVVAKLRSDEVQGGAQASSVEYWNRKVLGIYFGKVKTGFLNIPHINVVTDASTHSQKETIVSICYSHEMDSCALCPTQHVSRSKVIASLEFDLEPEIEILAATRKVERLAAYRFLAALSHQLWHISRGATLTSSIYSTFVNVLVSTESRQEEDCPRQPGLDQGCPYW